VLTTVFDIDGPTNHEAATGAALSPDGSLLAVNAAGIVQIFRVPQSR